MKKVAVWINSLNPFIAAFIWLIYALALAGILMATTYILGEAAYIIFPLYVIILVWIWPEK